MDRKNGTTQLRDRYHTQIRVVETSTKNDSINLNALFYPRASGLEATVPLMWMSPLCIYGAPPSMGLTCLKASLTVLPV